MWFHPSRFYALIWFTNLSFPPSALSAHFFRFCLLMLGITLEKNCLYIIHEAKLSFMRKFRIAICGIMFIQTYPFSSMFLFFLLYQVIFFFVRHKKVDWKFLLYKIAPVFFFRISNIYKWWNGIEFSWEIFTSSVLWIRIHENNVVK